MPNSRRRKFSVNNDVAGQNLQKLSKGSRSNASSPTREIKNAKNKNKIFPNNSRAMSLLEKVEECESGTTILTACRRSSHVVDKDVTASSSNIDLFHVMSVSENLNVSNDSKNRESRINRDRTPRRDKHQRQHRIKVRSPKRRIVIQDPLPIKDTSRSIGTSGIDWEQELQELNMPSSSNIVEAEDIEFNERPSNHSLDVMCRICHGGESLSPELGQLVSACCCRGTVGRVHVHCLERWLTESGKSRCELCGSRYATRRVHRYGVPKALIMWILSQNAKQLMVDSLGIMLMSPLAVLAAWLSGRTLAGLMTQQAQVTPWPLASTFVLACMTLVCYYCWIVSAATRHALGWWVWYRSQYEVRLQLQEEE